MLIQVFGGFLELPEKLILVMKVAYGKIMNLIYEKIELLQIVELKLMMII